MLRSTLLSSLLLLTLCLPVAALSVDDFAPRVQDLNVTAHADLPGFKGSLSTTFGVPLPRINSLIATVGSPADAYFCLRLGQLSGRPLEVVTREFQRSGKQGWGAVAKSLGIKPGSRAFHALKDTRKIKQTQQNENKKQHKEKSKGNKKGK